MSIMTSRQQAHALTRARYRNHRESETAKQTPKPARRPKMKKKAFSKLNFNLGPWRADVWIGSFDAWKAGPGSRDEPGWGMNFLEDGTVVGIRIVAKAQVRKEIEPPIYYRPEDSSEVAAMHRLRSIVGRALDGATEVESVAVETGGNGLAEYRVQMTDTRQGLMRELGREFFITMKFHRDITGG
jgi:hypothetical protein